MNSKRKDTGQIRQPVIIIITLIFFAMIISSFFLKLTAPDKESIQTLISELILVIVFPLLMFIFHIVLISREIKSSEVNLSRNHEEIEESLQNIYSSLDSTFPELIYMRISADKAKHERKKIFNLLADIKNLIKP